MQLNYLGCRQFSAFLQGFYHYLYTVCGELPLKVVLHNTHKLDGALYNSISYSSKWLNYICLQSVHSYHSFCMCVSWLVCLWLAYAKLIISTYLFICWIGKVLTPPISLNLLVSLFYIFTDINFTNCH